MAISFPGGLAITAAEPVDTRIVLTKAEMLAMKKARMPEVYFAICKDDGKLYLYNSTNTVDENTGRFRLYSSEATLSHKLTIGDIVFDGTEDKTVPIYDGETE